MGSEYFRVPETLEPDNDSLELVNDFLRERGNNLEIRADDAADLAQRAMENGSAFKQPVELALRACETLQQETDHASAEDLKISLYLSTVMFFKMSEADKEQQGKKETKKGAKAAAEAKSPHMEFVWMLLELFKKVTSLPKPRVNDVVHGKSLIQFCQQMALKVAGRCGRASQHKENLSVILASAETFDTVDSVSADMKLLLEEDVEGPEIVAAVSKHSAALGREVLTQVVDDISCMDGKDKRVSNIKDYLTTMAKTCLDLLEPNLVFLQSTLQSTQDTFATTILQCFLQYALQGCAEPSVDAETEGSSCSVKSIVEVFESRTLDKTCAVRVTALQCISQLAEHGVLTAEMYPSITNCTRDRISDKLVSVRKQALQTMEALITRNPFGNVLSRAAADAVVLEEVLKLAGRNQKRKSVRRASMAAPKDEGAAVEDDRKDDEENCNPNAVDENIEDAEQAQEAFHIAKEAQENHKPRYEFFAAVAQVVPALELLLRTDQESDVSGAVGLLKYLRGFDVPDACSALTKALMLVSSSLPTARGVIVDMFSEVYLSDKDHAAVVAGLLELLQSEPSLALEAAIKKCMELSLESGAEVSMHRVALVCISTAKRHMTQQRPEPQDVHRAELCLRLLTIFAQMKPSVCCGHLEELLKIRRCVLRVNNMGGTKGVLLQDALVKIILLMTSDPSCRAEVLKPEALKRVAVALLTVRGSHCLTVADSALRGLYAACKGGEGAVGVLLNVLKGMLQTSILQISKAQQLLPSQSSQATSSSQSSASQARDGASLPQDHQNRASTATDASAAAEDDEHSGCGPDPAVDDMDCDAEPPAADASAQSEAAGTSSQEEEDAECQPSQPQSTEAATAESSAQQKVHNACCALAHHFAFVGCVALHQAAFIEQRMEDAQRKAESMPSKKNQKESDHAMAGVFHCADISDDQELLQAELLNSLRTASDSVLYFFESKLLIRANTSLRLQACICIMRLANIDTKVAERALPLTFVLLGQGHRGQVEGVVAKQMVAGLADLLYNRPSLMMQYSKDMFAILVQDHHQHMRLSVTQMIIQLVMSGVLRFKEGIGHLVYLLVDTDAQVQRQVEFLFKKLHAQDKNTIFSVFPDILRTLCESTTLQHGEKEQILSTLSPYVTADKQNRNLIDNILGRMMVELPDVNAAKFCLHGVRLFKTSAETSAAIVKAIAYALPKIGEKLEDEGFAKLLLETTIKSFEQFKRARKADEGRIIEMQAAVTQVQDVVASCPDDGGAAGDETVNPGEDVDMQDPEAVDASQDVADE